MTTVANYFVRAASEKLREHPEQLNKLLAKNHMSPALLTTSESRVSDIDFANLLRDIMFATEDELLGLGTGPQPLGSWATMSQLCISAGTLGEALRRLARFYRFMQWGVLTHCQTSEQHTSFVMSADQPEKFSPYLFESFLFYVYRFSNWLIDRKIALAGVDFCFAPTPQRQEYRRLFFTNTVQFNQPVSGLHFANEHLKEEIRQNSKTLKQFLKHSNLALIQQPYRQQNWQDQVQKILLKNMQDNPCIRDISSELKLHPHTLRNYLRKEGIQFKEVKENLRIEIAVSMLLNHKLSIEKISEKLGYSETGAFTRAFKRWTGVSPLKYRHINETNAKDKH